MKLAALALVGIGWLGRPYSYDPLALHELIVKADLCLVGEIVAVDKWTVQVEVEQLGFGEAPGTTLKVARFKDWTCAHRWTPYAVGQRCLYFLARAGKTAPYEILGGGGEGESPMIATDFVRLQAVDAQEAFGNRTTSATPLLEEARRYRRVFRQAEDEPWIEPLVGAEELEGYRGSSPLAAHLCRETFAGARWGWYRDASARSPRAPEDARVDLGIGEIPTALAVLPDREGDGHTELVAARENVLELVSLGADGVRSRSWIRASGQHHADAAASLGDLGGDGTLEVALGESGFYRGGYDEKGPAGRISILSLDASGGAAGERAFGLEDPGFGELDFRPRRFGRGLACLGDLDLDGTLELAVSAGDEAAGWIWIVSLDAKGAVARARCVLDGREAVLGPLALAALGDLDGDGTQDLAMSAPAKWRNGRAGALVVLLLARDGSVRERVTVPGDERRGTSFGSALAALGDWDGDGVPDLAVGAPYGVSRVLFLARDGSVKAERELVLGGEALPEGAGFGGALVAVPRAQGGTRLLVGGFSAIERRSKSWWLRCYPSLWSFEP